MEDLPFHRSDTGAKKRQKHKQERQFAKYLEARKLQIRDKLLRFLADGTTK